MNPGVMTAYIGVGSNIDPIQNIERALSMLMRRVRVTAVSTIYRTKPLRGRLQNDYINGVWAVETGIPPRELKETVLAPTETLLGRIRTEDVYASRTIDLDLLLYGDIAVHEDGLTVPDPDIFTRPFIAIPLCEIAPGLILPGGVSVKDAADGLDGSSMIPDHEFTERLRRLIA
jgi:2-amino-4-hydroxy-6-hydroxymethyldihydropteridine diphosphokinase